MEINDAVSKVCELFRINKLSDFQFNAIKNITEKKKMVSLTCLLEARNVLPTRLSRSFLVISQKGVHDAKVNQSQIFELLFHH